MFCNQSNITLSCVLMPHNHSSIVRVTQNNDSSERIDTAIYMCIPRFEYVGSVRVSVSVRSKYFKLGFKISYIIMDSSESESEYFTGETPK